MTFQTEDFLLLDPFLIEQKINFSSSFDNQSLLFDTSFHSWAFFNLLRCSFSTGGELALAIPGLNLRAGNRTQNRKPFLEKCDPEHNLGVPDSLED